MADTLTTKEKAEEVAAWTAFLNQALAKPGFDANGQLVFRTSTGSTPRTWPYGPGERCRDLTNVDLTFSELRQCNSMLADLAASLAAEVK